MRDLRTYPGAGAECGDGSSQQRPELAMDLGASVAWMRLSFPAWTGEEEELAEQAVPLEP